MAEKDKVFDGKIKQTGMAPFKEFYSFSYDWIMSEGYDLIEKRYAEKVTGDSKDIEIEWEAMKKISDYFKFHIKIDWIILGMKEMEAEVDGRKIKTNKASFEIKVKGTLIKDYENKWEDQPFWKFLRGVYDRYIIRARIHQYEQKLFMEANDFLNQCKSFLAMESRR